MEHTAILVPFTGAEKIEFYRSCTNATYRKIDLPFISNYRSVTKNNYDSILSCCSKTKNSAKISTWASKKVHLFSRIPPDGYSWWLLLMATPDGYSWWLLLMATLYGHIKLAEFLKLFELTRSVSYIALLNRLEFFISYFLWRRKCCWSEFFSKFSEKE